MNLASLLQADAFRNDFEVAVVLSTDSDLVLPIKIVATELHLPVGILNPHRRFSVELRKVASQVPPTLTDAKGDHYETAGRVNLYFPNPS